MKASTPEAFLALLIISSKGKKHKKTDERHAGSPTLLELFSKISKN